MEKYDVCGGETMTEIEAKYIIAGAFFMFLVAFLWWLVHKVDGEKK